VCVLAVALLAASAAVAEPLPRPRSSPIFTTDAAEAASQLVGRGITLPPLSSRAAFDNRGHEIVWRELRRDTDGQGNVHVFYGQYVVGPGFEAAIYGSEVGVHLTRTGALSLVGGDQYTAVRIINRPAFSRMQAVDRGLEHLRSFARFNAESLAPVSEADRAYRAEQTTLRLVPTAGEELRFAYFTIAADTAGEAREVVLDAEDGRLLAVHATHADDNCGPTAPLQSVAAIGYPVRAGLPTRQLFANVAPDRPFPGVFTHEGYYANSSVSQSVYHQTSDPQFMCDTTTTSTKSYTLTPLRTNASGTPIYQDGSDWPQFKLNAAGDALYNTYQTMRAFSTLGRRGWDNRGTEAKVILEWGTTEQGHFIRNGAGVTEPTNCVAVGPANQFYNLSSSLDLIAHEWGHGVIYTSAKFPYGDPVGAQLHEGFADVIGSLVEKLRQPAGSGLEQSSDWRMHEDSADNGYARGAEDDDSDGIPGHLWEGPNGSRTYNDRVHRQDNSYDSSPHATGNMLHVVFRLLAMGGKNPICSRPNASTLYQGCSAPAVTALGVTKAGRILFDAVANTLPSTATWETLAQYVNKAAFDRYNLCVYDPSFTAVTEQAAVNAAFTAIGYPRLTPALECPTAP
jgi:Zn-dependent metalloprotease